MKYLKHFENYSRQQIEDMLNKAKRDSIIDKNIDINKIISKLHDTPKFGTFESFVDSEGNFLSEGDKQRMGEYIQEFKKLRLDTKKIEKLYPKLKRYLDITYREIENIESDYFDSKEEKNAALDKLYLEEDEMYKYVKELKKEAANLAKQAKIILNK